MYRVVKSCYLDMAHRLRGHQGKCQRLHGHTFRIDVSVSCDTLNEMGMVIDFGELKSVVLSRITDHFDHMLILGSEDMKRIDELACDPQHTDGPALHMLARALGIEPSVVCPLASLGVAAIPSANPTAENLAKLFFSMANYELGFISSREKRRLCVDYVRVYEQLHPTESYAEYREE